MHGLHVQTFNKIKNVLFQHIYFSRLGFCKYNLKIHIIISFFKYSISQLLSQKCNILIKHKYKLLNTLDKTACLDDKYNISRAVKTEDEKCNFTRC